MLNKLITSGQSPDIEADGFLGFQSDHAHSHDHSHNHNDNDNHVQGPVAILEIEQTGCSRRLVIVGMVAAGTTFVVLASMVDAFFLQEAWEYIKPDIANATEIVFNATVNATETVAESHSLTPGSIGFLLNLLPHIPWAIAIVGVKSMTHAHSVKDWIIDIGTIGLPMAVIGTAASWDFIDDISETITGEAASLAMKIPLSISAGLALSSFELRLHQSYLHAAGGNVLVALKRTFWDKLWAMDRSEPRRSLPWKVLITYAKSNVIISHGLYGYFGTDKLWQVTSLNELMPLWSMMSVNVAMGLSIAIFHGNSETYCMDLGLNFKSFLKLTIALLVVAGFLHTLPSAQQLAEFTHQWTTGPGDGALYNALLLAGYLAAFSPSIYAFVVTVLSSPMDQIIRYLGNGIEATTRKIFCLPPVSALDHSFMEPKGSRFSSWCCFRAKHKPLVESQELRPMSRSESSTDAESMIASSVVNDDPPEQWTKTGRESYCVMQ